MMSSTRLLPQLSFVAVGCLIASHVSAAVQTGSFVFDGQTINYQVFTGKDEAFFQSFATGATLTDFESVSGVTPLTTGNYNNQPAAAANFVPAKTAINGLFFSSGGQTPGNPENPAGSPFNSVLVKLDGVAGAHSGSNVLAASDFDQTEVKFSGGFFSFGAQTFNGQSANAFSRIGFWTNPLASAASTTPNIHVLDSAGIDHDNILVNSGILAPVQPGEFFAVAFDKPIIQEVEFVPVDHAAIDDVVYARDNQIAFQVPEPSTWAMLAAGLGVAGFLKWRRR